MGLNRDSVAVKRDNRKRQLSGERVRDNADNGNYLERQECYTLRLAAVCLAFRRVKAVLSRELSARDNYQRVLVLWFSRGKPNDLVHLPCVARSGGTHS